MTFYHRMRKSGIADARNFHPEARRIAHVRLAILKIYREEISKGGRLKRESQAEFISFFNAGLILPEIFKKPEHISRATLYNWDKLHRELGFLGLIPKYRWKPKPGAAVIPIKQPSRLKKIVIPGTPKRRAKNELLPILSREWEGPVLDCPIHLAIFYGMGIRKETKMRRRMEMLRHEISHTGKPDLDSLNAFLIDCMEGIVFKDHSQIVGFHSVKGYRWWPQILIQIRALPR